MIRSFRCKATQGFFDGTSACPVHGLDAVVTRKLTMLHDAMTLAFLRSPPGNRLEALKGDRKGQHSIRINRQYRVCFVWTDEGPEEVEIVDYHE